MNLSSPPCSTREFQKQLDTLCQGKNISLRIAWAPSLRVIKVVPENGRPVPKDFAKYPLVLNEQTPYVLGQFFKRNINGKMVTVGYQKQGGLVTGNVLPTDLVVPDIERVNHSMHLFVIEKRLPDAYAKKVHEKKRQLAIENLGFDLFGDFPQEGIWDFWSEISEHKEKCCEIAFAAGIRCRGLYREPDARDLEAVQYALAQRENRVNLIDPTIQIKQAVRDMLTAHEKYKEKRREEMRLMGREMDRLARRAVEKNSVYLQRDK